MAASSPVLEHDWLGACREAARGLVQVLADHPTTRERLVETGDWGGGGDRTLVIDAAAEDKVFEELEKLHDAGARFTAVSEERGHVDFGSDQVLVVIDPIDGSMNAKRGLTHHALSVAVADGPTMADVLFGYVYDLGPEEEWRATIGQGAFVNGEPIKAPPERLSGGKLELLAIESADPRWLAAAADGLQNVAGRIRAIGSIAISLCQVADTRVDGMATLWKCRAVDAAAAQLIVRESGGHVAFPGAGDGPLDAPLDLEPHAPVIAARTAASLDLLRQLPH